MQDFLTIHCVASQAINSKKAGRSNNVPNDGTTAIGKGIDPVDGTPTPMVYVCIPDGLIYAKT